MRGGHVTFCFAPGRVRGGHVTFCFAPGRVRGELELWHFQVSSKHLSNVVMVPLSSYWSSATANHWGADACAFRATPCELGQSRCRSQRVRETDEEPDYLVNVSYEVCSVPKVQHRMGGGD
ncbi:hypothetical protein chiPu_0016740 [Chiloscyllium punctatum]|uniref:Uncharacterized protein n=1 Tax=Chiloscyllium punctatum TaxID=137246 RepID=A0A401T6F1_CHIPU|nr:hypothetical protein [Chiloscyllium punctatum]